MKNFIEDSAESIMLNSMSNVFVTEKLDPVGQEDADIDNDGDSDSSDSYLRKRRKAVGAAIAADKAKRVKKEEMELALRQKVEGLTEKKLYKSEKATTSDEKETEITEKSVKNKVVINPDIAEDCWDGYEKKGMKTMFGKRYPNCVKKKTKKEEVEIEEGIADGLKGAIKAVKKGIDQEKKFQRASGETLDRMKRMTRHKQDKYGPSTLKQRLKTGADHDIDAEKKAKGLKEGNKSGDSSLHDWFSKSKSSDGKPGWVQLGGKYAGKPCAKQPGQTTKPKCGSSKMKADLSDKEEEKAFRRKNQEDPNPNRKGKAKNVATEEVVNEKAGEKDACYKKVKSRYSVWPSAYASGALVKCRKVGAANWGNKSKKEELDYGQETIEEKAVSRAQQKFMGLVRRAQKTGESSSPEVAKAASSMSKSDVKDFASTKHKGLPEKKTVKEEIIDLLERTRYAKETGKDFTTGNESKKGGTRDGKSAFDKVSRDLRKTGGVMSSRKKPIQPQGKKKEKGKVGYKERKGESGVTPVDRIKGKLAKKRAPKPSIGSRFD